MMRTARTCVSNTASASIAKYAACPANIMGKSLLPYKHRSCGGGCCCRLSGARLLCYCACAACSSLRDIDLARAVVSADADEVASSGDGDGSWSPDGRDGEPISSLATSAAQAVRQARAFTSGCRDGPPAKQWGVGGGSRRDPGHALRSDPTPSSRGCGEG